jgi:pyruvate/2-oxoglutarate dehydrogenase complex dihydrolipoamide acyltransferase (E2) component
VAGVARGGVLALEDVRNSTFTLSSTGSLEQATITATTPIINYPNVATLWVSRISDRPRVVNGELGAGPMMACSLSFDHRYLHGADGMAFINTLAEVLENPL